MTVTTTENATQTWVAVCPYRDLLPERTSLVRVRDGLVEVAAR